MNRIVIREPVSGRSLTLNDSQKQLFIEEWTRTKRFWVRDNRPGPLVAPDLEIDVEINSKQYRYWLVARDIMIDLGRRRSFHFYFGMLLKEWFDAANP